MEVVFVLVVLAGVFGYTYYKHRQAKKAWSQFAMAHDLSHSPGGWGSSHGLAGEYRGESIRVKSERRGGGKNSRTYTVYSVELPPNVPMDLVMYDQGLLSEMGKLFGGEDIQVGRSNLDEAFIIKGGYADEIREFLDRDTVAEALLDVYEVSTDFHLEHGSLTVEHRNLARSGSQLKAHLEPIVRCAKVLRSAGKANAIGTMDTYDGGETEEAEKAEEAGEGGEEEGEYVKEW